MSPFLEKEYHITVVSFRYKKISALSFLLASTFDFMPNKLSRKGLLNPETFCLEVREGWGFFGLFCVLRKKAP